MGISEEIVLDIDEKNARRLSGEVGNYHVTEAVKLYNTAIEHYSVDPNSDDVLQSLKRIIPHLSECKKLDYKDERLTSIINGVQKMIKNSPSSELEPIRL